LLDLEDEITAIDGVDLAAAHEDAIALGDGETVHERFELILVEGLLELLAGDAFFQAYEQAGAGLGVGDIPGLGFGFAPEAGGELGGRVDLEAEALAAIEPFYKNGEGAIGGPARPHHAFGVGGDELAQGLAVLAAGRDFGLGFGAIHDLPSLADGAGAGQLAAEGGLKGAAPPDAFLIKRGETERLVHGEKGVKEEEETWSGCDCL
jgi:hypothetical protein